jgi:hypothetical protein
MKGEKYLGGNMEEHMEAFLDGWGNFWMGTPLKIQGYTP